MGAVALLACGCDDGTEARGNGDTDGFFGSTSDGASPTGGGSSAGTASGGTSGTTSASTTADPTTSPTDPTTASTDPTTDPTSDPTTDPTDPTDSGSESGSESGGPTGCVEGETMVEQCDAAGNDRLFTCNADGEFVQTGTVYGCTVQSEPGAGTRVCPGEVFTRSCWPIANGRGRVDFQCNGTEDPAGGGFSNIDQDYCTAVSGPEAGQNFCPGEVIVRNNCPASRNYFICPEDAEDGTNFASAEVLDCNIDGGMWEPLHRGVEMRRWYQDGHRFRALRIDLCDVSLRVRATTSAERGQRTSSWASSDDLMIAAINGGFYLGGYAPDGCLAFGEGQEWPDSGDTNYRSFIALGEDEVGISPPGFVVNEPFTGFEFVEEAVCGDAVLVEGGGAMPNPNTSSRARTGAGFSADGNTMYMMTVDEVGGSSGVTVAQFAQYFEALGDVDFAINLDGGGSTTMWARGWGVVSDPSDGPERVVANHLGVFIEGGVEGYHCSE